MIEERAIDRQARRLAVLGGLLGVLGAIVLGSLRLFGDDGPLVADGLFGDAVFGLVYLSPYLLTLVASRTRRPAARGGLLMAMGILSLVASFSTFSLVTVVLLPATGAVLMAATWSLRTPGRRLLLAPPYFVVGLVCAAAVMSAFLVLFALEEDEPRCWTLIRAEDGTQQWQVRPNQAGSDRIMMVSGPGDVRGTCISDIITSSEGTKALGILLGAALLFVVAARLEGGARWHPV